MEVFGVMKVPCVLCVAAASMLLLVGCGSSGPETYTVSGTVTFDGAPVAEGDISFWDPDRQVGACGGKIVDGSYSFESSPGKKNVDITAYRAIPGKMDTTSNPGEETPMMEMYIPEMYNTPASVRPTTLSAEVVDANIEGLDFPLVSE